MAFAALGRVSPSYYTQDGVVPRSQIPAVMRHIGNVAAKYDLIIGNIFHAGDGNLHPLILFDMRSAEQFERVFIPQVNPRLHTDPDRPLRDSYQQLFYVFAHTEDFVDEIDVIHAPGHQRIHFGQHSVYAAFTELVTKESLIAKRAGPRAAASELQLRAQPAIAGKDVVTMAVGFNPVALEIQGAQSRHVSDAKRRADVKTVILAKAASGNFPPCSATTRFAAW